MPVQTLNTGNFGQSGFLPDVAPSLLPQNGFSYARNWRFNEGGHAVVTSGYTNAFDTRGNNGDPYDFGGEATDLTFIYTWELNEENAVAVFDGNANRMLFTENNSLGGLSEYNLSIHNDQVFTLTYTTGTPGTNEFTINASGELVVVTDGDRSAGLADTKLQPGNEVAFADSVSNKPSPDLIVSNRVRDNLMFTVTFQTPLDDTLFENGTIYSVRGGEILQHDSLATFKWEGSDALGVPVFNNEVEVPYQFVEGPIPKIAPLEHFPLTARCRAFSSFGSVLVAVGYQDDDGAPGFRGNTRTLAFSNPITNAGELPEWDFANLDSQSQIIDLSLFTDGVLVSAFEANNRLIVNSTTDVIAITDNGDGTYTGTKLEIGGGTLTKRTSVAIPNGFFNIGNGQFYIHDTNNYQQIGKGQYSESWFNSIDEERLDEVQVIYDPRTRSVWIKTPISSVSQEIWIINLQNNYTLDVLDDHQEVRYLEWSAEGTPAETVTWDNFPVDMWDEIPQNSWNEFPIVELGEYRNRVLGCGGREVFVHDFGPTFNGRPINAVLEKSYFKLGAQDSYSSFQFDRVVPWIEGASGSMVDVRVGTADNLGSPVNNTPYQTYRLGSTSKLDFRHLGRWGSITFRCLTSGVELSGVEIQVNSAGKR